MTYDELEARFDKLDEQIRELQNERRAMRKEIEARLCEKEAVAKWNKMSEGERDAIIQVIQPKGVASKSNVGGVETG
jgi:uncharacterized protein YydD (DUF2326 family)